MVFSADDGNDLLTTHTDTHTHTSAANMYVCIAVFTSRCPTTLRWLGSLVVRASDL